MTREPLRESWVVRENCSLVVMMTRDENGTETGGFVEMIRKRVITRGIEIFAGAALRVLLVAALRAQRWRWRERRGRRGRFRMRCGRGGWNNAISQARADGRSRIGIGIVAEIEQTGGKRTLMTFRLTVKDRETRHMHGRCVGGHRGGARRSR